MQNLLFLPLKTESNLCLKLSWSRFLLICDRYRWQLVFPVALPSICAAGGDIALKSGHFICLCLFVFQVNIEEAREARARNAHAQRCDLTAPTRARTRTLFVVWCKNSLQEIAYLRANMSSGGIRACTRPPGCGVVGGGGRRRACACWAERALRAEEHQKWDARPPNRSRSSDRSSGFNRGSPLNQVDASAAAACKLSIRMRVCKRQAEDFLRRARQRRTCAFGRARWLAGRAEDVLIFAGCASLIGWRLPRATNVFSCLRLDN